MKFKTGDQTDIDICQALCHECFRCNDAFKQFCYYAEKIILKGQTPDISYRAYNAYSDFILHLYEFYVGILVRAKNNTDITNKKKAEQYKIIDSFISRNAQRILDGYCESIKNGTAPDWVNDISYYDVTVPPEFASDLRRYRNKVIGHVSFERINLSLSEFYQKYHKYLFYMYREAMEWWGQRGEEFPDLKEITDFTITISNENN